MKTPNVIVNGIEYYYIDLDKSKDFDKTGMTSKQILDAYPSYEVNPFVNNLWLMKDKKGYPELPIEIIKLIIDKYNKKNNTNY